MGDTFPIYLIFFWRFRLAGSQGVTKLAQLVDLMYDHCLRQERGFLSNSRPTTIDGPPQVCLPLFRDLNDVTLAEEDTDSILTGDVRRAIHRQSGNASGATWYLVATGAT